jgi:DNA invertase Pin-like site-specific DNA recombinase
MKRAIIYARVSTQRQADDGVSMESQIEQCRVKAHALGTEVVEVFRDDGVSGRSDKRPGFQAALAYCAAHKVSHFVCWSTSRFGRNLEEALKNAKQLLEWGTKAAYVHQDIDLDTDAGWMLGVMTGMMDEIYSRNVARDTLRSMITASRDGFFVGGRAPFGYRIERVGKRSKLAVHDDQAAIVRKMYALALDEGLGAQAVALRMNAAGLLREGKAWGKNSVMMILKNPSYMGVRLFNQIKFKTREAKPADEVVQVASHPAIVSKEDFEKVQAMMKDRTPHEVGGTAKSCFAFTGLLKCGICGDQLQIKNGTGRGKKIYNYYACLAHKNGKPRCCLKPARADVFDTWMVDELLEKVLTITVVQKVIDDIKANGGKWAEERAMRRKALVKELREAEFKRDKIFEVMETLGKDTPNLAGTVERLNVFHESIKDVQQALEDLETKQAPDYRLVEIDPEMAVATIQRVIRACPDPKQLRMLMNTFVKQISVSNAAVIVEYREDALLRSPIPTVHTGISWLPAKGSLRTGRVEIERPMIWANSPRLLAA